MKAYYFILISLLSVACNSQKESATNTDKLQKEVFKDPKLVFDSIYVNRIGTNQEVRNKRILEIEKINSDYQSKIWGLYREKKKFKSLKNIKFKYVKAYLYDFSEVEIVYDGKHLVPDILAMKTLSDKQAEEIFKYLLLTKY